VKEYYDRRAPAYDDAWVRRQPEFLAEAELLGSLLADLPPARTLDVACGTGFLTRFLPGEVTGLDSSEAMLAIARRRLPGARLVRGDALALPFPDAAFERVFTSFFYDHLRPDERARFLAEARRVATELVVVVGTLRDELAAEAVEQRVLDDGSCWPVLKRYFTGAQLVDELGGGRVVHEGRHFLLVRS
jgi:demethylmenaquinone methyltransferase/2-methoxy-6-polyprenyl-1,4-benzoquinol methylase